MSKTIKVLFSINLISVVLKTLSATGTSAVSVFLDLLNDAGDTVGLGLLLMGLHFKPKNPIAYPYGTRRAVYVLGLVFIILVSVLLFVVSLFKMISLLQGEVSVESKPYAVLAFAAAFALNLYGLYVVLKTKRTGASDPASTSGLIDALSDSMGSFVALLAMITGSILVDTIGSFLILAVILISAVTISHRYFHVLVGKSPPKDVLRRTLQTLLSLPEVKDVNVFNASMITEDEYMLVLEVEVDREMDVEDLEKLSNIIEEKVKQVDPRFKHVVVEFVAERKDKTYRRIVSEVDNLEE
ncbi:MAG: cation diffusion facilitator family transporter [Desulfurococcaceae archaeon]